MKKGILFGVLIMAAVFLTLWFTGLLGFVKPKGLYKIEQVYKDNLGKYTRTIQQQKVDLDEVQAAYMITDSLRNEQQKKLAFAKQEIEALNIKLKRAKSITFAQTSVADTFTVYLRDTIYMGDDVAEGFYTDGYLSEYMRYDLTSTEMFVDYIIQDTVIVVDSWKRKPTKKGRQACYLIRWLKPWTVKVDVKSRNENSEITNGERILFNNRKQ